MNNKLSAGIRLAVIEMLMLMVSVLVNAQTNYDFSAVTSGGQLLYYSYLSGTREVKVTHPGRDINNPYATSEERPSGALVIPSTVRSQGVDYTVKEIDAHALQGCEGLRSVTIPSTIERIGFGAFSACTNIDSILFEPTTTATPLAIGAYAFYRCRQMRKISLPQRVYRLGAAAFEGCAAVNTLEMPAGLDTIHERTFYGCSLLHTVTLGSVVRSIGWQSFYGCNVLDTLRVNALMPPTLHVLSFDSTGLQRLVVEVPCGAVVAYQTDEQWSQCGHLRQSDSCGYEVTAQTVDSSKGIVTGSGRYPWGATAELQAVARCHYAFVGWNDGDETNPRTLTVEGDTTVVALFSRPAEDTVIHVDTIRLYDTIHLPTQRDTNVTERGDTVIITLCDTTLLFIHDTLWQEDTIQRVLWMHDTVGVTVYDTVWCYVWIHDTVYATRVDTLWREVHDTLWQERYYHDTLLLHDTVLRFLWAHDTTYVQRVDTTVRYDTIVLHVVDTLYITQYDTVWQEHHVYDTVLVERYVTDTVIQRDTLYVHDTTVITPAIADCILTVVSDNVDRGLGVGSGRYCPGSSVEIAAIPLAGYTFTAWDDGIQDNPRKVHLSTDTLFIARFVADTSTDTLTGQSYRISVSTDAISIHGAKGKLLSIYDILGRPLRQTTISSEHYTIRVHDAGVYLVKVGNTKAQKVLIVK